MTPRLHQLYRTVNEVSNARRPDDVGRAASALLHLRYKYGQSAIKEAIALASEAELNLCPVCSDFTRHCGSRCQQCLPPLFP
jgi:hypothetical protein